MSDKRIEMIEEYIKHGNGDYEWYDNHGQLVRCRDCISYHSAKGTDFDGFCKHLKKSVDDNFYCAWGVIKEVAIC